MGYFDGLTSSNFKTTADGRKLFFPWGVLGHGYIIAPEDGERLRKQLKISLMIGLALIIVSTFYHSTIGPLALGVVMFSVHVIWMKFVIRHLQRTEERMSWQESMTTQAGAYGLWMLWSLEIGSILLVFASIGAAVDDPDNRMMGICSAVFFGVCVAVITRMLWLRRRRAAPAQA